MIEIDGIKFCTEGDPAFFLPAWVPIKPNSQMVYFSAPPSLDWKVEVGAGEFPLRHD
jgi:hypothetical protein